MSAILTVPRLHFEADHPHQLNAIALRDDTIMQSEIEAHFAVDDRVLKMDIVYVSGVHRSDVRQRQIVCADHPDGPTGKQSTNYAFCSDQSIFGIGPLKQLIQQKENRRMLFGEIADLTQTSDLRIETRTSFLQRVVHQNACTQMQG